MLSTAQVNSNIKAMLTELRATRKNAGYLLKKIADEMPEEFMGAGDGDMAPEDEMGIGGAEMTAPGDGGAPDMGMPPGEKKEEEIKTPEEAKKVVNEAITDLKAVVDGIDAITGQGEEMEEKTASQTARFSSKMQNEFGLLTKQAASAIDDAKDSIRHWAFLLRRKHGQSNKSSAHAIVQNVREGIQVWRDLQQVLATAVPPTGAEFSGDKGINGDNNYSARKEIKHYEAGNEEFKRNKTKEDRMPNPTGEPRLIDEGNPHEFGAFVNAKVVQKNPVFGSAIVMRSLDKEGRGKYAVATWEKLSPAIGPKTAANYEVFTSKDFAKNVEDHIRKNGIETVAAFMNAELDSLGLQATAREPKVKDKSKLRAYYADAFGDSEFARELTSAQKTGTELGMGINQDKAGAVTKSGEEMNIAYKPEVESADGTKGGLEGGNTGDSVGTGAVKTEASLAVREARARKAVDFARIAASRGLIPFTKTAVATKAREVVGYSNEKFDAQLELLNGLPIVREAAIKEARIPENEEVETGILANTHEAVRDPKNSSVGTEGLKSEVKSEGRISTAAVVPQMHTTSSLAPASFVNKLNTIANRMRQKGLDPTTDVTRRVKATYRQR